MNISSHTHFVPKTVTDALGNVAAAERPGRTCIEPDPTASTYLCAQGVELVAGTEKNGRQGMDVSGRKLGFNGLDQWVNYFT